MGRSLARLQQSVRRTEQEYLDGLIERWSSKLPDAYRGHTIDEIELDSYGEGWAGSLDKEGYMAIKRYIDEPTTFLILRGTAGTGKSTLAATLGEEMIRREKISGMFVNSISFFHTLSFSGNEMDPIAHFSEPGILVIDDLGAVNESLTPHRQQALWGVIENRWSSNKLTIITTNMAIQSSEGQGLKDYIGTSGYDRVASSLTRVTMQGESFRTSS